MSEAQNLHLCVDEFWRKIIRKLTSRFADKQLQLIMWNNMQVEFIDVRYSFPY
jgi:hypothetical protein